MWRAMCAYRLRIGHEAFCLNTLSPMPRSGYLAATTLLGDRIGSFGGWVVMFVPRRMALRHADERIQAAVDIPEMVAALKAAGIEP